MRKNKFFDISTKAPVQHSENSSFKSKYLLAHYEKVRALEVDLKRLPAREEFYFLQTDNAFNAFTFIPWICKTESIKTLCASTYSISRRVIESLVELHDCGRIEQVKLMVSDSMIKRNPVAIDLLQGLARSRPNIEVLFAWVHAKVCIIDSLSGYYCIEGSGNWSENAQYEQYVFGNSKGLYDFRMKLFTDSKLRA